MTPRLLAGRAVRPVGLGCMGMCWAYGPAMGEGDAVRLLHCAIDLGYDHFDTAALYGGGQSETLLGRAVAGRRDRVLIASKVGLFARGVGRGIDGRPETIRAGCDTSLARLGIDHIDLFYLHRLDPTVPIEESVGAIGLSEVSAVTLRRAANVHPIAAVQTEYSPWSRNAEIAVLNACRSLGTAFVAFSPLARGVLAGGVEDPNRLGRADIRRYMPRFTAENWPANRELATEFALLAEIYGMTPAQLSLAWILSRGDHVHAIPGTTSLAHLEENAQTMEVPEDLIARIDWLFDPANVSGPRYPADVQAGVDTEEFG
ncbi:aldo/keto reductase [Niveispirillum cyanobacteriorum]|uniref:Aldo/keto reductase n=1 Tax=Niveispirillum cyanobacteriorum TaxID=1612173 RepID=A0A2K9NHR6_9PROT|nr:aldo/keto reductase [Niveispirillum cyanobacteriorum]AUN32632.1 aldo/keto reductase [Niveispirillum cyanobacteriorum]GGE76500.1 aldo/keto reductase [Niveispirillum cyanobacteriorum]